PDLQTVIADVGYQYGPNLASATPKFWTQVIRQQWTDAIDSLRNFGDNYQPRRDREADLLQNDVHRDVLGDLLVEQQMLEFQLEPLLDDRQRLEGQLLGLVQERSRLQTDLQ